MAMMESAEHWMGGHHSVAANGSMVGRMLIQRVVRPVIVGGIHVNVSLPAPAQIAPEAPAKNGVLGLQA